MSEGNDGRVLIHCHAGCEQASVVSALGLTLGDLFDEPMNGNGNGNGSHRSIVATYPYVDEADDLLFEVVRMAPKDFRQRRPDPTSSDGWSWSTKGVRRVVYRLPAVIAATQAGRRVFIVEGEKDVHAIEAAGEVATCNPGGAKKWRPEYAPAFAGAEVVIVADRDEPGREHARMVQTALEGVAKSVTIVEPAAGKDAADHLSEGLTLEQFVSSEPAAPERKKFRSGQEIFESAPVEVPWCWDGYAAFGTVTLFAGRHKGGKSTLLFELIGAMCEERDDFLGHPLNPGTVVLLTEEGPETLRPKLAPISENGRTMLRVLSRADVTPRGDYDWTRAVREAGAEAREWGARLVIVDTFAFWAQIRDENDNSLMQEVVSVLAELTTQGLAVIVVHHSRKEGGEDGNAIRGASSLQGAVDIIVEMVKPAQDADEEASTDRELRSIGRFPGIPEALRLKMKDGRYVVIGEGTKAAMKNLAGEAKVLQVIKDAYPETVDGSSLREQTGQAKETSNRYLRGLEAAGTIEAFDDGKGRPKRYRWNGPDAPPPFPRGPLNGG